MALIFLLLIRQVYMEQIYPILESDIHDIIPESWLSPSFPSAEDISLAGCKIAWQDTCPDIDIRFYLYSLEHPDMPENITFTADKYSSNLNDTAFRPSSPSKIIIHGFNSSMNMRLLLEIKIQYLQDHVERYNVFGVDWSEFCRGPCYPAAVWNLKHVGECTAQFIQRLLEIGAKNIHVIGFSLGAQMGNFISNALLPYKLPRITGLDPCMPGFVFVSSDKRLDQEDAEFVDAMHTNAFMQGTFLLSGHVDFFMNGGVAQPGCLGELRYFRCNHHRAPIYFAESINTKKGFYGWPCSSYSAYFFGNCPPNDNKTLMGEHVSHKARGIYWVLTNGEPPFAAGRDAERVNRK